jgi:hypothetical protein
MGTAQVYAVLGWPGMPREGEGGGFADLGPSIAAIAAALSG